MRYNESNNYVFKLDKYTDDRFYMLHAYYRKKYISFEYDEEKDIAYDSFHKQDIVSDKHKEEIKKVVDDFKKDLDYAHNNYICADFNKANFKIYYKRIDNTIEYDYFLELYKDSSMYVSDFENKYIRRSKTEAFQMVINFWRENKLNNYYSKLENHPIYLTAKENGERLLELRIKDLFSYVTKEENEELEKLMDKPFLRRLSDKYDIKYSINPKEIDQTLLWNSGYIIFHRPYFAMPGSTHDYYEINPHTKNGVDAAKKGGKIISFKEFLELFKEDE